MIPAINRAADAPLRWGVEALWAQLSPVLPGLGVEVLARSVSTNTELLERARLMPLARNSGFGDLEPSGRIGRRQADIQPCLLVAEHQTGGRGRMGRTWRSTPGASLTFSIALPLAPADWSGLSLAVGVALAEALQPDASGAAPQLLLKWPNDLWFVDADPGAARGGAVVGRKLGGVLIETLAAASRRLAVVGVGLNVLPVPEPAELPGGTACLQEIEPGASAPATLARIALPLLQALKTFEREGFAAFASRYAARDLLRDQPVTTTQPGAETGVARGVTLQGALRVETAHGVHLIASGEVSVRPASAEPGE